MPVQFSNLTAKVFQALGFPPHGFTPYEVVIGAADGDLAQVSGLGSAGEVLTSNGPGAAPTWQPGGGGGGGGTRMPWDVLGGWVGSTYDIGLALGGQEVQPTIGQIRASAVVAGEATSFSTVRMLAGGPQTGTGTQVAVTDSAGNWLAHATNADAQFTGINADPEWVFLTLNTPVTPTAGEVLYVMYLFPFSTVSVAPFIYAIPLPNFAPFPGTQSEVAFPSGAGSFTTTNNTIPNPQAPSGLVEATPAVAWAALVP